jgi:hypothetical protein
MSQARLRGNRTRVPPGCSNGIYALHDFSFISELAAIGYNGNGSEVAQQLQAGEGPMTVIAQREMQQGLNGLCRVAPRTTPSNDRFHAQRTRTDGLLAERRFMLSWPTIGPFFAMSFASHSAGTHSQNLA